MHGSRNLLESRPLRNTAPDESSFQRRQICNTEVQRCLKLHKSDIQSNLMTPLNRRVETAAWPYAWNCTGRESERERERERDWNFANLKNWMTGMVWYFPKI
jgi:hypothetical protein